MEGVCGRKAGQGHSQGRKGRCLGQDVLGEGQREQEGFYHWDCSFFLWAMEGAQVTEDLMVLTRKFQPGRGRLCFWERLDLWLGRALNMGGVF